MGAVLEAARTQLALADALVAGAEQGGIPRMSWRLLAQARERFLAAGATWDLAEAKRVAAGWELPGRAHGMG